MVPRPEWPQPVLRSSPPAARIGCGPPYGGTRCLESPRALLQNDLAFKAACRPIAGAAGSAAEIQQAGANLRTLALWCDVDHRLQDLIHQNLILKAVFSDG